MTKRHKNNGLDKTQRAFEELKISGWIFVPDSKIRPGNQAQVCRVESKDGDKQAFCKFLPTNPSDKEVARFRRELSILSDEAVAGLGIVQLYDLDRGSEPRWHVTELGTPFKQYWKQIRKSSSPEELAHQAATICSKLAGALSRCHEHENEHFHRDIKPDNIVITSSGHPALIDFGVAFSKEIFNRLTNIDESVGNRSFSPDRSRQFDSNPSAWIDIFGISQLFLWMIEVKPPKHFWPRPIHWEHVVFDSNLNDETAKSARALGAACSVPRQGPQNGRELKNLIRELFPLDPQSEVLEGPFVDLRSKFALHKGQYVAEQIQKKAIDSEMVAAALPIADQQFEQISNILLRLLADFSEQTGLMGSELTMKYSDQYDICARYHIGRKFALGGDNYITSWFTGYARLPGDIIVPEGAFHQRMKTDRLCCIDFTWYWSLVAGISEKNRNGSSSRFTRGLEIGVLKSGDLCWSFNGTHGPLVVGTIQELSEAMIKNMSREGDLRDIALRLGSNI